MILQFACGCLMILLPVVFESHWIIVSMLAPLKLRLTSSSFFLSFPSSGLDASLLSVTSGFSLFSPSVSDAGDSSEASASFLSSGETVWDSLLDCEF